MKNNIPILTTATIYVAGVAGCFKFFPQIAENFQNFCEILNVSKATGLIIVSIPLAIACLDSIKRFLNYREIDQLATQAESRNAYKPGWFRLRPFDNSNLDISAYKKRIRADNTETHIAEWIEQSSSPILYLTGKSGTGKSSLLAASVVPLLKKSANDANRSINIIGFRIYRDPITDLEQAILGSKATHNKLLVTNNLREMLEELVQQSPLLLVIDQFEEFLILHRKLIREPFEKLIHSLIIQPIPNLQLLLVVREDYLPELEKATTGYLPKLRLFENWRQVGLFDLSMASQFLRACGKQINRNLLLNLLEEANQIEEAQGQYRPITLNMLGLALERNMKSKRFRIWFNTPNHRMLQRLLADELGKDPLPRQVLTPMVTEWGTKRVMVIDKIAKRTGIEINQIKGCLRRLEISGLVRQVNELEQAWEISHDFVARLIAELLSSWKASIWRQVRPWVLPTLCFIGLIGFSFPQKEEALSFRLQQEIASIGMILDKAYNGLNIRIVDYEDEKLTDITDHIELIAEYSRHMKINKLTIEHLSTLEFLPKNIGKIKHLQQLNIDHNNALTIIPESIGQVIQLQQLNIRYNRSLTKIPESIGQLTKLKQLDVRYNNAIKNIPESIGQLTQLRQLSIVGNNIFTTIADRINSLDVLPKLVIYDNNHITALPESIGQLIQLRQLHIGNNHALTTIPESISRLENLWYLSINNNTSLISIPTTISQLTSLEQLRIGNNHALAKIPDNIGQLTQLKRLYIDDNKILEKIPESISLLKKLQFLRISNTAIKNIPESIGELTLLKKLHIDNNHALITIPENIGHLNKLIELHINNNDTLTEIPDSVGNLNRLMELHIDNNDALTAIPDSIEHLAQLIELHIDNNDALTSIPDNIENLTQLMELHIDNNDALTAIPESIGRLSLLEDLSIDNNNALTNIPDSIGQLTHLQFLSISNNNKIISIPETIGNLQKLQFLNISENLNLKTIPTSVKELLTL